MVYSPAHLNVIAWVPRGVMSKQAGYVPIDSRKYERWLVLAYGGSHDETWFKFACSAPITTASIDIGRDSNEPPSGIHIDESSSDAAVADLEHSFTCVMYVLSTEGNDGPADDDDAVHEANYISLRGYAQELAFLPDSTKPSVTELDYTAPNVKNSRHAPIKQRARRIPLRHLQKLYELLKRLLKAGLIAFSNSSWASLIVIVLKKNGQDIRLCIDYKMVSAVIAIREYAMPFVTDLLTELESIFWLCSLNAASGFWAIMMMMCGRKTLAFVCAWGHFE
ncbi:hypothetical protein PHMEG_00021142 [Phytophthora megakarya]|uniref:Reverse transcriptase n=1 Tax=Phytophthora megakarya TaxID=4795 RepID=A0A225VLZ6_9STRA|nr:hypothetical protein PHMEG_00021142 [Phytophthora megakarya]